MKRSLFHTAWMLLVCTSLLLQSLAGGEIGLSMHWVEAVQEIAEEPVPFPTDGPELEEDPLEDESKHPSLLADATRSSLSGALIYGGKPEAIFEPHSPEQATPPPAGNR